MTTTYCTVQDVLDYLAIDNTEINTTQLENIINQKEDYLDDALYHTFRTKYIRNELHSLQHEYLYGGGVRIPLRHRYIHDFNTAHATEPDKVELLSYDAEYITLQHDSQYTIEGPAGILYLRRIPFNFERERSFRSLRVTYHYGETPIPSWVKELMSKIVSVHLLRTSWQKLPIGSDFDTGGIIDRWQKEVDDTIAQHSHLTIV